MIKVMYRYRVAGLGQFPLDMLRYDSAWPASEADSGVIHRTMDWGTRAEQGRAEVEVWGLRQPTRARWESFGWAVGAAEIVKV